MGRIPRPPSSTGCQAHEEDNLFVTDAAPFVSNADENPDLSIPGLAWRTERLKRRGTEEGKSMSDARTPRVGSRSPAPCRWPRSCPRPSAAAVAGRGQGRQGHRGREGLRAESSPPMNTKTVRILVDVVIPKDTVGRRHRRGRSGVHRLMIRDPLESTPGTREAPDRDARRTGVAGSRRAGSVPAGASWPAPRPTAGASSTTSPGPAGEARDKQGAHFFIASATYRLGLLLQQDRRQGPATRATSSWQWKGCPPRCSTSLGLPTD